MKKPFVFFPTRSDKNPLRSHYLISADVVGQANICKAMIGNFKTFKMIITKCDEVSEEQFVNMQLKSIGYDYLVLTINLVKKTCNCLPGRDFGWANIPLQAASQAMNKVLLAYLAKHNNMVPADFDSRIILAEQIFAQAEKVILGPDQPI